MLTAQVVFRNPATVVSNTLYLYPGVNLTTGEARFRDVFGALTSLEIDILTLVASIYASDLAFKRGERENITRQIALTVPVVNLPVFHSIRRELQFALYRVSHDAWNITFVQRSGTPESSREWHREESGKVLLFSGGLDSFAGAVLYGAAKEHVQLVSHVTANPVVSGAQETLYTYLQSQFPSQFAYSTRKLPPIPRQSCHQFHMKTATDSM